MLEKNQNKKVNQTKIDQTKTKTDITTIVQENKNKDTQVPIKEKTKQSTSKPKLIPENTISTKLSV